MASWSTEVLTELVLLTTVFEGEDFVEALAEEVPEVDALADLIGL